jgi:CHAD domain-containing protein
MKTGERAMAMATCVADLTETTPVADAARRVLCMRLETVRDRIGEALTEVKRGGQRVHALRVATRRAAAAVDLFRRCLPHKVGKHLRSRLRLIRRAAGEARDWDVVLGELTGRLDRVELADRPAHDMLSGFVLAHRIPAEQRLRAACRDYPFGFDRLLANSLASIRQRGPDVTTFGGHARPTVLRMVTGFDALCQRGDGGSWEQLHEVRIAAKRLRYALELVQSCIDPGLGGHIATALASLQETLGTVNDSFNESRLLRIVLGGIDRCLPASCERYRPQIERRIVEHEQAMDAGREAFARWLVAWRSSASVLQGITSHLPMAVIQPGLFPRQPPTADEPLSRAG